jgi:sialic acid synthase SpsE
MRKIKIGHKIIGDGRPSLISLEPAATYTNLEEAKKMLVEAANGGADAIKFQTFLPGDSDRMMGKKDIMIEFGTKAGKKKERVYDALKRRELTKAEWVELVKEAKKLKLLFITAPYFPETVDFLLDVGVDAIKVSKGDVNNVLLIERIAKTGLPVILDAREKLSDVNVAVRTCQKNKNEDIVIMHCPSGYPANDAGIHLRAIQKIREKFDYPVGFSDHFTGDTMNYAAIALGANMLEKTITINRDIEHVEHYMSLETTELKNFIKNIRAVEAAMGSGEILKKSRVEESARRSFVAKRKISKGEKITLDILDYKRPGDAGISVAYGFKILNKKVKRDIPQGTFLKWGMLE